MKYLLSLMIVACAFLAMPTPSAAQQVIRCDSSGRRHYCSADTSGGVQLSRQISRASCRQGSTWGYTPSGVWVDRGCRAEFRILGGNSSYGQTLSIRCESNDGQRHYCPADTRDGVRLQRQISGTACIEGSTWGYDQQGVWVDQGCRADFTVLAANSGYGNPSNSGYGNPSNTGYGQSTIRCESKDGNRHYCNADTRNGVRLKRQISRASCRQGSTWGYDQQGVWVDRSCRADFTVLAGNSGYGNPSNTDYGQSMTLRCESNDGNRQYCSADTRGGVTLTRQISDSACVQGSTWGYDQQGVWVDRGCRADFSVMSAANGNSNPNYPYSGAANIIPAGTEIDVRTNELIDSTNAPAGQKFTSVVANDVRDNSGAIAIPKGSDAELVIRSSSNSDLILDIDSLVVNGRRYVVSTADVERKGRQGVGANKRTGEIVGGSAALGAIIGAIAGGGKGAAIGAAVGAAAGAGTTAITKGREVKVPAETMLKFTLDQDLRLQLR